ncbi:MAG: LPS assembly protein LptD [Pseudomonadota bacterium]
MRANSAMSEPGFVRGFERHMGRSVLWTAIVTVLAIFIGAHSIYAQDVDFDEDQPVALIADDVTYDSQSGVLTATGNVEVYFGERTLTADQITYNEKTGRIAAVGDIVLRDPEGTTVFGDVVDLDAELTDGLIEGAQSILGDQGKLAAVEARRFEERYNVLSKAVYSPCDVCTDEPTPLWRIRARRIIHDEEEKQVHYESAWFDLLGVPLFWTPYFRHPDPTVDRASGFLTPSVRNSSNYGFGLLTPYYIVIDDQSDLTIEPFFTSSEGTVGIAEYRHAFSFGKLSFLGSIVQTDFTGESEIQGHIDTRAEFFAPHDFKLGWNVRAVSDDAYLRFFDFSSEDTLESDLFAERYKENSFIDVRVVRFQSLRNNEPAGQIPLALPDIDARYEFADPYLGGEFGLNASSRRLIRTNGKDTTRVSFGADWERQTILPFGLAVTGFAEVNGDFFSVSDDPDFADNESLRLSPLAGVELRYPLIWETESAGTHFIEPIAQAIVAPYGGNDPADVQNEDSLVTEFDEINLFDRTRFSGRDGFEEGPRLNLGVKYAFETDGGFEFNTTGGRVLRFNDADEFSSGTGLVEAQSDWVVGWQARYDPYFTVGHRMRLADDGSLSRNDVSGRVGYGRFNLGAQYTFLEADPDIGQDDDREEVSLGGSFRLSPNWRIRGSMRRDLELDEFVSIASGITYANECCEVDVLVSRSFTNSANVPASTSVGVQIRLLTLGTSDPGLFDFVETRDPIDSISTSPDR